MAAALVLVAGIGGAAERERASTAAPKPDAREEALVLARTDLKSTLVAGAVQRELLQEAFEVCESFIQNYLRAVQGGNEITRAMTLDELIAAKVMPELTARGLSEATQAKAASQIKTWVQSELRLADAPINASEIRGESK